MKNKIINYIEKKQMVKKKIPFFKVGYLLEVQILVVEGDKKRIQSFEGLVLSKRNRGLNSSFVLRKISHGEGIERVFQTYSPVIYNIIIKKKRFFKKSKLYYLRFNNKKFLRSLN